jgi:peptidylprolyl isomerase
VRASSGPSAEGQGPLRRAKARLAPQARSAQPWFIALNAACCHATRRIRKHDWEFFMSEAKTGDTVKVHYTGTLADGSTFDSSRGEEPLEFRLGEGNMIAGFENAVLGMTLGEQKTITIPCEQAYGERNPQMRQSVPRSAIPDDIELAEGLLLHAQNPEGQTVSLTVVAFDDEQVSVDGNHPLAGHDLIFDLELVAIA